MHEQPVAQRHAAEPEWLRIAGHARILQSPAMADLFDAAAGERARAGAPLADRLRPADLDGFVGQAHIAGPGTMLRRAIEEDRVPSSIFHGPPGTGKTTLARIIASVTGAAFEELSAVQAGKPEVREVIGRARDRLGMSNQRTILFLDEIHRFNKAQQDALLPVVESGLITLIGATTENPYFELNQALLSRCALFEFHPLTPAEVRPVVDRAAVVLGVTLEPPVTEEITLAAGGDARAALAILELAHATAAARRGPITVDEVREAAVKRPVRFDRDGDVHYDVASAFIKSMRGSDPDAAVYWLAVMIAGGEDPRFIARRMVIFASEDVGNADPRALDVAVAVAHAVELVGLPEGRINLAQGVTYLALAPKSNASVRAIDDALGEVRRTGNRTPPDSLRDGSYRGARQLGRGQGYVYPHNYGGFEPTQRYLPDELQGRSFYDPADAGFETRLREVLADLRARRAGTIEPE
jgi:putative ATPase